MDAVDNTKLSNHKSNCPCKMCERDAARMRGKGPKLRVCRRCEQTLPPEAVDCPLCGTPRWAQKETLDEKLGQAAEFVPELRGGGRFGQPSAEIVENPGIPEMMRLIYVIICCNANGETGIFKLSVTRIAEASGRGISTVRRYLRKLEGARIVKRISEKNQIYAGQILVPKHGRELKADTLAAHNSGRLAAHNSGRHTEDNRKSFTRRIVPFKLNG